MERNNFEGASNNQSKLDFHEISTKKCITIKKKKYIVNLHEIKMHPQKIFHSILAAYSQNGHTSRTYGGQYTTKCNCTSISLGVDWPYFELSTFFMEFSKTVAENWVSKQFFFCFDIDYGLNHIRLFCFIRQKTEILSICLKKNFLKPQKILTQ